MLIMSRLSRFEYIKLRIAALPSTKVEAIRVYVEHSKDSGVRLCNDKFPDTRFLGTYPRQHQEARWIIERIRHEYKHGRFARRS